MLSSLVRFRPNRFVRRRWFWLLNGVLLLLYLWTLTGQTRVAVTVNNGVCTAIVPGRTVQVECPQLRAGSRVGLYLQNPELEPEDVFVRAPLDWLAPHAAWNSAALLNGDGSPQWTNSFTQANLAGWEPLAGNWQIVAGELRASSGAATILRSTPASGNFIFTAELRRPEGTAGLLLLEPDGERGFAFITSGASRRGMWWRWVEGKPDTPLIGVPFARPLAAQFQWLLRVVLRAHQGALLLLLAAWLLSQTGHVLKRQHARWSTTACAERSEVINESFSRMQQITDLLSVSSLSVRYLWWRNTISPPLLRSPAPLQSQKWPIIAVILLLFAATLFIASDVLERIPHVQDSVTYLFQAQTLAGGRLWAPAPPLPDFFEQEFLLVRDGRWFGKYPPGFPALLAIGVWLKLHWLINPLLATLTVPLLYVLGAELYDRRTALLAVALGLTSPFFLFMSGSTMAHPAELFWITLFLISWLRALRTESRQWAAVAGLAVGMALLTRQLSAIAVAVPFVAATILRPVFSKQAGEQGHRRAGVRRFLPRSLTPLLPCGFHPPLVYYLHLDSRPRRWQQVIVLGLAALPFLFLLLGYQWALTGSPWQDPRLLYWNYDTLGFGPNAGERANLLRVAPYEEGEVIIWYYDPSQPPRGHSLERGLHNTGRNWQELEENLSAASPGGSDDSCPGKGARFC